MAAALIVVSIVFASKAISARFVNREEWKNVKFIAHRGLSSKYYENSEEAFVAAGRSAFFYGIETDVHFTSDGVPVCAHDDKAFADSRIAVTTSKYDDIKDAPLKKDDYGYVGSRLCRYEKYLSICAEYDKVAVIEIKQLSLDAERIKIVVDMAKSICGDSFVIISFDKNSITTVNELYPSVVTQHIVEDHIALRKSLTEGFDVTDYFRYITKTLVDEAHGKGKKVGIWTVNNIIDIQKYAAYGVDYITTDYDFS